MTTLSLDDLGLYDAALDGLGLLLAWDETETAYNLDAPDTLLERTDFGEELAENKLDTLYWGASRSWHDGAGQVRLLVPDASSANAFFSSKGVDISKRGELRLIHKTLRILTLTNQSPAPQVMTANDAHLWVAAGQPNIKRFADLAASDQTSISSGTETSKEVLDLKNDGVLVYAALGADGIHRYGTTTTNSEETFDTTTGWSGTNLTFVNDTAIKKQGTGSLRITDTSTPTGEEGFESGWSESGAFGHIALTYDTAEEQEGTAALHINRTNQTGGDHTVQKTVSENYADVGTFRLHVKPRKAMTAGQVKVRLQTSVGNYYQRTLPALTQGVWYEDVSAPSEWTAFGTPNWASITQMLINISADFGAPWRVIGINEEKADQGPITLSVPGLVGGTPPPGFQGPQTLGVPAGTLLVASVAVLDASSFTLTPPEGWTQIQVGAADSNKFRSGVWYYVTPEFTTASFEWTLSPVDPSWVGTMIAIEGYDPNSVVIDSELSTAGAPGSLSAAAISPQVTNENYHQLLTFFTAGSTNSTLNFSTPTNGPWTEVSYPRDESGSDRPAIRVFSKLNGGTSASVATVSGLTDSGDSRKIAYSIAFRPAAILFDNFRVQRQKNGSKAYAKNFSAIDQLAFWVQSDRAGMVELRLQTSVGNYFYRRVTVPSNSWVEDTSAKGAWISVGAPNWASIATMLVFTPGGSVVYLDDLRSITASAFAHWSDWDARVLNWSKDQLFAAGIKTGTQWRFFQAGATTTSEEIYVLPDGWQVDAIAELGGFVYFAASRANKGIIYAYDGEQVFVALPSDAIGAVALSLTPFGGAGLLVGARQGGVSTSGGLGLVFRCFPSGSGHLSIEKVHEIGNITDGRNYAPRAGQASPHGVRYGWGWLDTTSSGLGIYYPDTGAYATNFYADTYQAPIVSIQDFKGRTFFTVEGKGVFAEQDTYVSTGWLISSLIDLNVAAPKRWLMQETSFAIPAGASVSHEYSIDKGLSFTGLDSALTGQRLLTRRSVTNPSIQYRINLTSGPDTPVVTSAGIGGWPASNPLAKHVLMVRAYDNYQLLNGEQRHAIGHGWEVLDQLKALRDAGEDYDYQPPWWKWNERTLRVRVANIRLYGPWGTGGAERQGGIVELTLKEIP